MRPRVLAAIPAHNEASTIAEVVARVRAEAPDIDLLIVNDGSRDATGDILARLGVTTATHLCNLGYGRALQSAIMYADRCGYDVLITLDADGQHRAGDVRRLSEAFRADTYDVLIGSRFVQGGGYQSEPLVRRLGMHLFSTLIAALTGQRVHDTTSGLKAIHRRVFAVLASRPFVDFHAETIAFMILSGYRVGEYPIAVDARRHGSSMYSTLSAVKYPLKVAFLILVGAIEARRSRARRNG